MMYVNGVKILKADQSKMTRIDGDGWDHYDGRNHQWYSLYAKQLTSGILYKLDANNSGDCYGDYKTRWFFGSENLMRWIGRNGESAKNRLCELLGNDIDEESKLIKAVLKDCRID